MKPCLSSTFVTLAFLPILLSASTLTHVNYGAFTQTATYSIANQLGLFTANNLNVTYLQIPNSTFGYASLLDGTYDILTGTIDNAVNLRFNSNASLAVIGQLDQGPDLVVAAVPGMKSVQELRGKSLMVDAPTSGYAFVLRKVLGLYGLQFGVDYDFQVVGATSLRYAALTAGRLPNGTAVFATILTYPFTGLLAALPEATAPQVLARVSDFVNPFSSGAFTVRTNSLDPAATVHSTLVAFVRAMLQANRVLANATEKAIAVDSIAKQLNVSDATAQGEYGAATDPATGETSQRDFNVSSLGLWDVVGVREQFDGFEGAGPEFDFVDAVGELID